MAAGIDREELRALVREALRESLAASASAPPARQPDGLAGEIRAAVGAGRPASLSVAVGSGADLDRFARGIAEACDDSAVRAAILAGNVRFEPAGAAAPAPAPAAKPQAPAKGGAFQLSSGILSEAKIVEIARSHRKILVGPDVVMTPLARDKAREMKVELVRQKP